MIDLAQFWRDNPKLKARRKEFGVFGMMFQVATNAVNVRATLQTRDTYDFICTNIRGVSWVAAGPAYSLGPVNMQLINESRSRNVTSIPLEWSHFVRTNANASAAGPTRADEPWYMPYPILLAANSQLTMVTQGTPFASTIFFSIGFHGIKVFH